MSSTNAAEMFERGKTLYDREENDEALQAFSDAVRLETNNADYHAWLARTLIRKGKHPEAWAQASLALQLDPHCQSAYHQRAFVHLHNKDYQKAIQDCSQAIALDPTDYRAFYYRDDAYFALKDYENALADRSQYFRLRKDWEMSEWSSTDPTDQLWYKTVHQHFTENLLPRLKAGDETYVGHWPCGMTWGERSEVRSYGGDAYTMRHLSFGTGYVCLTTQNIRLYSFGQVSQQIPLFNKGFIANFIAVGFGNIDRKLEKRDQAWTVPYQTVTGAQIGDQSLKLVTPAMTWDIYWGLEDLTVILAGISLGISGKFSARETSSTAGAITRPSKSVDVVSLLKQLGELKAQGIITDAEFEEKKKGLLARL